jgi:hypothetical protein
MNPVATSTPRVSRSGRADFGFGIADLKEASQCPLPFLALFAYFAGKFLIAAPFRYLF